MNGKKLLSYYVENNFLDKFLSSIHAMKNLNLIQNFYQLNSDTNINNKKTIYFWVVIANIITTINLHDR